jgi:putative ABC transport system permease protein
MRGSLRSAWSGLRALVRRSHDEREIDRELQAFVDAAAEQYEARGVPAAEARRRATIDTGNLSIIREDVRATGWERLVDALLRDARLAFRLLRRAPAFSATIILTLALGIAGNTAILSVLDATFFAPLPVPTPDRVLRLLDASTGADGRLRTSSMHSQTVALLQSDKTVFSGVAAMFGEDLTLTGGGPAERVVVIFRTEAWRDVLGVVPRLGRDFTADEEQRGRDSGVALVSDRLWNGRLAGAGQPGGVQLRIDDRIYTVVGVMPSRFHFPYDADVWVPWTIDAADRARDYAVFGRLQDGVTDRQARAAMATVGDRIRRADPDALPGYSIGVRTLRENLVDNQAQTALALLLIVVFLLLLACVNVATLLLARSVSRRKEFVVRSALGASSGRQVGHAVTEALILTMIGGVAGVALAMSGSRLVSVLIPSNISAQMGMVAPPFDWRVLSCTLVGAGLVGVVVGLIPATTSLRESATALREGGRDTRTDSGRTSRTLNAFVVGQAALALVLVAGAGLMLQELVRLQQRDLGFTARGLLTMEATPSVTRHPRSAARAQFIRQVQDTVAGLPGVTSAGVTTVNPLGGGTWGASVVVEGLSGTHGNDSFNINHRLVTPELFQAMGIPLLRGRGFTWSDDAEHPGVAIVSARMAQRFWPQGDPIGKRIRMSRAGSAWLTVVGVVGNVLDAHDPGEPDETWYLPYAQSATGLAADEIYLMIRAAGDAASLTASARSAVATLDPDLALHNVMAMDRYYADTLARQRIGTVAMALFGAFGLLLATLGANGVMAFTVARRVPELGMRMALGADRRSIVRLVLGRGLWLGAIGVALGCAAAALVNRMLAGFLVEVGHLEPTIIAAAGVVLLAAIAVAAYLPARRAASLDPLVAIRGE